MPLKLLSWDAIFSNFAAKMHQFQFLLSSVPDPTHSIPQILHGTLVKGRRAEGMEKKGIGEIERKGDGEGKEKGGVCRTLLTCGICFAVLL